MRSAFKAITFFVMLLVAVCIHAQSRVAQSLVIDQLWQFSPDPKAQFTATSVDREAKWRPARASLSWNSPILGWEAASVMPEFVIAGLREQDSSSVLAGVFCGWLNSNRAYLTELDLGSGRMFLTTFPFGSYGQDGFATLLLDQMLSAAAAKTQTGKVNGFGPY